MYWWAETRMWHGNTEQQKSRARRHSSKGCATHQRGVAARSTHIPAANAMIGGATEAASVRVDNTGRVRPPLPAHAGHSAAMPAQHLPCCLLLHRCRCCCCCAGLPLLAGPGGGLPIAVAVAVRACRAPRGLPHTNRVIPGAREQLRITNSTRGNSSNSSNSGNNGKSGSRDRSDNSRSSNNGSNNSRIEEESEW